MSSKIDADSELTALALSEARETVNKQLDIQSDIDTKAAKILRINTLLLGLVISALSLLHRSDAVLRPQGVIFNGFTVVGLGLLVASVALSALTYSASDSVVGLSRSDVETLIDGTYGEAATKEGLALAFGEWIEFNSESIDIDAFYFTTTTTLLVWALSSLCLGFADAVSHPIGPITLSLVVGALVVFTCVTEWPSGLQTWIGLTRPVEQVKALCGWGGYDSSDD